MRRLTIATATPYDVLIARGLLDHVGDLIKDVLPQGHIQVVSDSNVAPLYAPRLLASLTQAGYTADLHVVEAGEGAKAIAVWQDLLESWAQKEVHRDALVCALGGGVVGDLTGFAAASYQRGMDFIQIPTTFLAAIDSSVGGKTAVNLQAGKNLVGAFHQPRMVLCDPESFTTLTDDVFREGVAEALKYGILSSPALFQRLKDQAIAATSPDLADVIETCVRIKNTFVEADTFDKGQRQQLNLGHTPAHAIEALSSYTIPHGQAVATGLAIMTRASEHKGIAQEGTAAQVEEALLTYDFSLTSPYAPDAMGQVSRRDKKAGQAGLTVVLPRSIGQADLFPMAYDDVTDLYRLGKEPLCK